MILVTGATGLSGSLIINEFARQQVPVRALVRDRAKARAFESFPDFARRHANAFLGIADPNRTSSRPGEEKQIV